MALLEADQISIRFGGLVAVDGVSFAVDPGQIFTIIGPNGAGKTTIFNIVSRLYTATSGRITLAGEDITRLPPYRLAGLGVARTFQNIELFEHATVIDNLLVGRHVHVATNLLDALLFTPRARRQEIAFREEAERIVGFLGLQRYRDSLIHGLPYGVRKNVELARALMSRPKLLLLDEPSSGLTTNESVDLAWWLREIRDRLSVTILMVEHNMRLVSAISDRVLALNHGRIIAEGSPTDVQRHPEVVRAYIGE
jgi:branched-chain amino acid transport system ATP-binding protein